MIGFYNASVILTYLGVVSAVFGMSALCLAGTGERQAALLRLVGTGSFDDLRINRYV